MTEKSEKNAGRKRKPSLWKWFIYPLPRQFCGFGSFDSYVACKYLNLRVKTEVGYTTGKNIWKAVSNHDFFLYTAFSFLYSYIAYHILHYIVYTTMLSKAVYPIGSACHVQSINISLYESWLDFVGVQNIQTNKILPE